jgi:uncharacterized membrane protein
MKRATSLALPAAIGVVAGLRSMTAPAVLAYGAKKGMIHVGDSSLVSMTVGTFSRKAADLAVTELLVDKLPFVPDRTRPGPLAWRALSGAACGAAVASSLRRPAWEGAVLGFAGAMVGAFAGHYLRSRVRGVVPGLTAAVVEDAAAITLGSVVIWQTSRT